MNQAEVICRNSLGMWDMSTAVELRDRVNQISPFKFVIFACKCCTKYHLTARTEKTKA